VAGETPPELATPPLQSGSLGPPFLRCGTASGAGLGSMLFKFNLFIDYHSSSALDSNLGWGSCLSHVGTEGQRERWVGSGLVVAERQFHGLLGYKQIPTFLRELETLAPRE